LTIGKGKRLYLTLPMGIYNALERWAESEGNKAATLGTFLIEREVREALKQGRIPDPVESNGSLTSSAALLAFLDQLAQGSMPSKEQISDLADSLGISANTLTQICDRLSH
jgi:hypothetical protein